MKVFDFNYSVTQLFAFSALICLHCFCHQCFDAVGWASRRASSL